MNERVPEERQQIALAAMYAAVTGLLLLLAGLMAGLGTEHARRARGARLGTWQGGRWA